MSEISKIKVITLAPFIASEYHLWTASALATFQVYKVDKLVLGEEQEPRSDDQFQGWQSVGSIRFPDPGPTEISRTWSCSDLDIHFNGRIRIESSLQLLKYRSYCSVLYVYPEKVGRRIE